MVKRILIIIILFILLAQVQGASATLLFDGSFNSTDVWTGIHDPFGVWPSFSCVPQPDSLVIVDASTIGTGKVGYAGKFFAGGSTLYDCSNEQHNQIVKSNLNIPYNCIGTSCIEGTRDVWYGWSSYFVGPGETLYSFGLTSSYYATVGYCPELPELGLNCNALTGAGLKLALNGQHATYPNRTYVFNNQSLYLLNTSDYVHYGVWEDWAIHVYYMSDNTGFLEVYKNETLVWSKYNYGTLTKYLPSGEFGHRLGFYRESLDAHPATLNQTVYILNAKIGTTMADVAYSSPTPPIPSITSWSNNKTNNNTLSFIINISESVTFNFTVNQTLTSKLWNGVNTNSFSHTISWSTVGTKYLIASGSNSNGTVTNPVTWTIIVQDLTVDEGVPHLYGINGTTITTLNSVLNHTSVDEGNGKISIGNFSSTCINSTGNFGTWQCVNESYVSDESEVQKSLNHADARLYFTVIQSETNKTWNAYLRADTSRASQYYRAGVQGALDNATLNIRRNNATAGWITLNTTVFNRTLDVVNYIILDETGNIITVYASNISFADALSSGSKLITTENDYGSGNYFALLSYYGNIKVNDIKIIQNSVYTGDIQIWDTSDSGDTITAIKVTNCDAPAGTSCKLEWKGNSSETWIVANSSFSGDLTYSVIGNQNQSNDVRLTLVGISAAFPSFDSVEFVQSADTIFTIRGSGGDDTWASYTQNNVTEDLGDHNIKLGLFADNFDDGDFAWSQGGPFQGTWSVVNGKLIQSSISVPIYNEIYPNNTNFTDVDIQAKITKTNNQSSGYVHGLAGRRLTDGSMYSAEISGLTTQRIGHLSGGNHNVRAYINTSTQSVMPKNVQYTFRFQAIGNNLKMKYWNNSITEPTWMGEVTNNSYTSGSPGLYLTYTAIEADDFIVRGIDGSGNVIQSGNFTSWKNWTDGNVTYQVIVNATTLTNTNYSVLYRQNNTGDYVSLASAQTGNTTHAITTKYQNTDVRIVLNGNETVTPELIQLTYYSEAPTTDYTKAIIGWWD